jgi:hypothetical protein
MILSVSRRTDIPAFYSEWFFNRIKEGFLYVRNPINKNLVSKVIIKPELIDCIVFWSKNPKPLLNKLHLLDSYKYYFQFTVNPYNDTLEKRVPKKNEVIDTFIELSEKIGNEKVIWRYDPIFYTNEIDESYHVKYFEEIAKRLYNHTDKCVVSFLDLYKKCERNLKTTSVTILEEQQIEQLMNKLKIIAEKYNLSIETCAEDIDLQRLGIKHGRCIDNELIERIIDCPMKTRKDKNQREICGCIESIDVGVYNTCLHNCLYCYANFNSKMVDENVEIHSPSSPLLVGQLKSTDELKERKIESLKINTLFNK